MTRARAIQKFCHRQTWRWKRKTTLEKAPDDGRITWWLVRLWHHKGRPWRQMMGKMGDRHPGRRWENQMGGFISRQYEPSCKAKPMNVDLAPVPSTFFLYNRRAPLTKIAVELLSVEFTLEWKKSRACNEIEGDRLGACDKREWTDGLLASKKAKLCAKGENLKANCKLEVGMWSDAKDWGDGTVSLPADESIGKGDLLSVDRRSLDDGFASRTDVQ